MRVKQIAKDIDLVGPASADGTIIDLNDEDAPFLPGYDVICAIHVVPFAEASAVGSVTLQGREETNDAWTDLATADGADPSVYTEVKLTRYIRYQTDGASASDGRASVHLLGN